ncbi:hypothetical protein GCM10008932_02620 [Alkalibacterium iburiense]|uniref:Uncharacterized protein n=1 Tax=Alkalibacterium iburiense TaxID=290589 RepID=A0ABN0X1Z6_9LACT
MDKNNEVKRPGFEKRNEENRTADVPIPPDTSAPMGYINDRPLKDKKSEELIDRKAKGGSPSNEVELSLNPDEENASEEDVLDDEN